MDDYYFIISHLKSLNFFLFHSCGINPKSVLLYDHHKNIGALKLIGKELKNLERQLKKSLLFFQFFSFFFFATLLNFDYRQYFL